MYKRNNEDDGRDASQSNPKYGDESVKGEDAAYEDELEDFVLINPSDITEGSHTQYDRFPWLDPEHPLYFSSSQPMHSAPSKMWRAVDKFSVKNWYPYIKEFTFQSQFVTLDYEDILFLIGQRSSDYDSDKLEQAFNDIISQFSKQEAFIRLSTRSPKDSSAFFDKAAAIMSRDITYWPETTNRNQQLVSFVASMTKAMKMTNGKQIIEAIQNSPRVQSDLLLLIGTSSSPADCTTDIVLRKWYDIRPDHEFRVFVSRRDRKESVVTAVSQYFHFLYFDKTSKDCFNYLEEVNKKKIIQTFQNYVLNIIDPEVADFLNFSDEEDKDVADSCREYIVDLALISVDQYDGELTDDNQIDINGKRYVLMVIELTPFAPSATGPGLFNWETELNLLWGKAASEYPVFKDRTQPRDNYHSITLLPSNFEQVIESALIKRLKLHSVAPDESISIPPADSPENQSNRFFVPHQVTASQKLDGAAISAIPPRPTGS